MLHKETEEKIAYQVSAIKFWETILQLQVMLILELGPKSSLSLTTIRYSRISKILDHLILGTPKLCQGRGFLGIEVTSLSCPIKRVIRVS